MKNITLLLLMSIAQFSIGQDTLKIERSCERSPEKLTVHYATIGLTYAMDTVSREALYLNSQDGTPASCVIMEYGLCVMGFDMSYKAYDITYTEIKNGKETAVTNYHVHSNKQEYADLQFYLKVFNTIETGKFEPALFKQMESNYYRINKLKFDENSLANETRLEISNKGDSTEWQQMTQIDLLSFSIELVDIDEEVYRGYTRTFTNGKLANIEGDGMLYVDCNFELISKADYIELANEVVESNFMFNQIADLGIVMSTYERMMLYSEFFPVYEQVILGQFIDDKKVRKANTYNFIMKMGSVYSTDGTDSEHECSGDKGQMDITAVLKKQLLKDKKL